MFNNDPIPEQCHELWQYCQQLLSKIITNAPVKTASLKILANRTLDFNNNQSFYLLKEGILQESFNDTRIINYEVGDLVGIQSLIKNNHTIITSDFAVTVDEYDITEFLNFIASDKTRMLYWNTYLANMIQSFQLVICEYKKDDVLFHPEIRNYEKGQNILQQGETDNGVYTLISGTAEVIVDDTQVGKINCDEIFGAIAALTGTARTADVIAASDCTVMVVPSERFQTLLASRPELVTKLIKDMAGNIISGNRQIVSLSSKI